MKAAWLGCTLEAEATARAGAGQIAGQQVSGGWNISL